MNGYPELKSTVDRITKHDAIKYMESGKGRLKNPSPDWQWHRPADSPGKIRLIPKEHQKSLELQDILHPGSNGQGGFGLFK